MCASILHFRKERNHESQQPRGNREADGDCKRYEAMSHDVIDMHLFDEDADEEKALCGAETSYNVMGVPGYLEDRVHGLWVRSICQECKALAVPLAGGDHRGRDRET